MPGATAPRGCLLGPRDSASRAAAARCGPDFVVVGARGAGARALFAALAGAGPGAHATTGIAGPASRRLAFWTGGSLLARDAPRPTLKAVYEYLGKFPPAAVAPGRRALLSGEVSPDALYALGAPANLARFAPLAKILVVLREPAGRAFASYDAAKAAGAVFRLLQQRPEANEAVDTRADSEHRAAAPPLWMLIVRDVNKTMATCPAHRCHHTLFEETKSCRGRCRVNVFVHHGYYAKYLRRWLAYFPPDRVHVADSDALVAAPVASVAAAAAFLGVPPRGPGLPSITPELPRGDAPVWDVLAAYYAAPNRELAALLDARALPRPRFLASF